MSKPPADLPPGPAAPPDRRALAEAYQELIKAEVERQAREAAEAARPRRPRGRFRVVLATVLVAVAVYLWVADVPWLRQDQTPGDPPAVQQAGMRLAMYLQAQRLEQFRATRHRLPRSLEEAGRPTPGIAYRLIDSATYELRATSAGAELALRSDAPADEFLGRSLELLRPREAGR